MIVFCYRADDNTHAAYSSTLHKLRMKYGENATNIVKGMDISNPIIAKQFEQDSHVQYYGNYIVVPKGVVIKNPALSLNTVRGGKYHIEYDFSRRAKHFCGFVFDNVQYQTVFEFISTVLDDFFQPVVVYDWNIVKSVIVKRIVTKHESKRHSDIPYLLKRLNRDLLFQNNHKDVLSKQLLATNVKISRLEDAIYKLENPYMLE